MTLDQKAAKAIAEKGQKIYDESIKPLLDLDQERGKFVVIDVESGDYEIDKRGLEASRRLRQRNPNAVTYRVRIGFSAALRMGGRSLEPGP